MSEVRGSEGREPGSAGVPAAAIPAPDTRPPASPAPAPGAPPAPADPDAWLPEWFVGRPLTAGWAWAGFWAVLIVADEFLDLAG